MMHMTFYWSKSVTLLFTSWKTDSWTSYVLTLVACFLVAVFYQNLESFRIQIKSKSSPTSSSSNQIDAPLILRLRRGSRSRWTDPVRYTLTALFGVNVAIGYMLMLAVMSFNGGVFVAIVAGLTAGFFLFRSRDEAEEGSNVAAVVDGVVEDGNTCACS